MKYIEFEWDSGKNTSNKRKHGVAFEEARSIFYDENALQFADPEHSGTEDRFLMLGMSFNLRVLIVCHCYRESEGLIRIISARKANQEEEKNYWGKTP